MKNKQLNVSVDPSTYSDFQKFYPQCLSRFVRNAIKMALSNRSFFESVLWFDCPKS